MRQLKPLEYAHTYLYTQVKIIPNFFDEWIWFNNCRCKGEESRGVVKVDVACNRWFSHSSMGVNFFNINKITVQKLLYLRYVNYQNGSWRLSCRIRDSLCHLIWQDNAKDCLAECCLQDNLSDCLAEWLARQSRRLSYRVRQSLRLSCQVRQCPRLSFLAYFGKTIW